MSDSIKSYSQCGEDMLLWRALKDIECGFYIDVGGFDPTADSVTKIFYDAGWSGITLEPTPVLLEKFLEERPRDTNLGIAVSDRDAEMDLNLIGTSGLTTLVDGVAQKHISDGLNVEKFAVRTQPLADIWETYVPEGQHVHFLKIDVEGAEEAVIRGANWKRHRPWVLVVEAVEPNSTIECHQEWDPILRDSGYLFVYFDGLNRYYVAKEKSELKAYFAKPLNAITEHYIPYSTVLAQDQLAYLVTAYADVMAKYDLITKQHGALTAQHSELSAQHDTLTMQHRNLADHLSATQADLAIKEGLL